MTDWKFDPHAYKPGDRLWLRIADGWSDYSARSYTVSKVTPSGQVLAKRGDVETRFTKRGDVMGVSGYSRECVISEEQATCLIEGAKKRRRWRDISALCEEMSLTARKMDADTFTAFLTRLQDMARNTPSLHVEVL